MSISILSPILSLGIGDTVLFTAVAKNKEGEVLSNKTITWTTSDAKIINLDAGKVIAVGAGSATVTASYNSTKATLALTVSDYVKKTIKFGPDVPPLTVAHVDILTSATESLLPGGKANLVQGKSSLYLALDKDNRVLLMGEMSNSNVVLGAQSTALALVKIILSTYNKAGSEISSVTNIDNIIQTDIAFQDLVKEIQKYVTTGSAFMENVQVAVNAIKLASNIVNNLGPKSTSHVAVGRTNTTVSKKNTRSITQEKLPYYFIKGLFLGDRLWLADTTGNNVKLYNDTRLDWKVTSFNNNTTYQKTLDRHPFPGFLKPIDPAKSVPLEVPGSSFTIKIEQTSETHKVHIIECTRLFCQALLTGFLNYVPVDDNCLKDVATIIYNEKLTSLITNPDNASVAQYFKAILDDIMKTSFYSTIQKCQGSGKGLLGDAKDYLKGGKYAKYLGGLTSIIKEIMIPYKVAKAEIDEADNLGTLAYFGTQMLYYWNYSAELRLCKNNGVISECVQSIIISNAKNLNVGDNLQLKGTVIGDNGNDLSSTHPITWISSDDKVATVDIKGLVSGISTGTVEIDAENAGVKQSVKLTVNNPFDKAVWAGYYKCPTWECCSTFPGVPPGTLGVKVVFSTTGNQITGVFTWAISGVSQIMQGTVNNNGTITWLSGNTGFIVPSIWNISGNAMTGEFSYPPGGGCQNIAFNLTKL